MVRVGGDGVEVVAVGDEAVVAPVGPQLGLGTEQAAAAYDQAQLGGLGVGAAQLVAAAAGLDGGLSHLGLAAAGVFDACPGVVVYGRYSWMMIPPTTNTGLPSCVHSSTKHSYTVPPTRSCPADLKNDPAAGHVLHCRQRSKLTEPNNCGPLYQEHLTHKCTV